MRISKQARREAKDLFRACQVNGLLDAARVRQAVGAVAERKPRGYAAILHFFLRLVRLDVERRSATVESAVPLTPGEQSLVQANLQRLYGPGLDLQFATRTEAIGGMCIRVGSDVYDGTIRGRLAKLNESF